MDGWVKLWRKSIDSAVFADLELWKLWCMCLMLANHREAWVDVDGLNEPIKIMPGQFITGRYELYKSFYPRKKKNNKSALTLWRKLQNLENLENLNIKSYTKFSIITINNWNRYQQDEQRLNNRRTTDEQQMNTNKNVKNDKNDKKLGVSKDTLVCPSQKIIEKYHEICTELPPVGAPDGVAKKIKARWKEDKTRQSLEWWEALFKDYILPSDFLMGSM